ncbi:HECT-like ubiquitin-conjugating enzyme-binding-domain-containing protein [Scheffersomyces coipomensis]|uniref:HECT-like ubiquitin-conjugating enzyme-binding-domain-containing protein n=1 Tax=Scheffersomyces coipomensis TaxID=1788519 RepID=UPI00315C9328
MSQTSQRWSCKDLKVKTPKSEVGNYNEFTFNCSTCEYVIIDSKDFKFLDMPSEFWYELMDYWHCHKPDNHDHHEKNYNGSLKPPNDKTIVIGSNYLLVKFTDTIDSIESKKVQVHCQQHFILFLGISYWDRCINRKHHSKEFIEASI